jgi:hypothetical protein
MSRPNASSRDVEALEELERRVSEKWDEVDGYLSATCRRRGQLAQMTIIAGSVAAALTAAPALGGKPVSDWLNELLGLADPAPAWRLLCLAAMICSLAATIATQLHKTNNYDEHITRAQDLRASLEVLDVAIVSGHLNQREATTEYLRCVENASFMETNRRPARRSSLQQA